MISQDDLKSLLDPKSLMELLSGLPDADSTGAETSKPVENTSVPSPYANTSTNQPIYSASTFPEEVGEMKSPEPVGVESGNATFNQQQQSQADSDFFKDSDFGGSSNETDEEDDEPGWVMDVDDDGDYNSGESAFPEQDFPSEPEGVSGEAGNANSSFIDPSQGTANDGGSANFVETGSAGGTMANSASEDVAKPLKPLDLFDDNYGGMGAPAPMPAPAPEPFSIENQMMSSQSEDAFLIPPSELMKILDGFDDFVAQATGGQVKSLDEYMAQPEMQAEMNNARQAAANKTYDFETAPETPNTASFNGNNFTYTDYNQPASFKTGMLNNDTATAEDKAKAFSDVTAELTEMVEKLVGGFDRVTDLAVISDKLIINGVAFCPTVSSSFTDSLPYDLKNGVAHGCFAWLFDFNSLRRMTRLCRLKVDTRDFVFSKIRVDLGILYDFTPKHLFKVCKDLQILDIAGCVTQASDMDKHKDMFLRQSQAAKMYDKAVSKCWSGTKYCWHSIRSVFKDPKRSALSKVWGISVRSVGMATVGAVTSAGKLGQIAAKAGKGFANFVHMVKDNR